PRFLTPLPPSGTPPAPPTEQTPAPNVRHNISRDLALLYRLALDMGSAASYQDLVQIVLDGLLEGIPADVGAVLSVKEGRELELIAYHHGDPKAKTYHRVSEFS